MREHPRVIVVTDSYVQPLRGDLGCTAEIRAAESEAACKLLDCGVLRLGIQDDNRPDVFEFLFKEALKRFARETPVYLPALQGGHVQHDIVSRVGGEYFKNVTFYATYARGEHFTPVGEPVIPTDKEIALKNRALDCYQSQLNLSGTRPHFDAVRGKPEYLLEKK